MGENRLACKNRKAIREALLCLIKKKSFQKISVRDITETADISRSTFYNHYEDIYDLLRSIEEEIIDDVCEAVSTISRENYIPGEHPQHISIFDALLEHQHDIFLLTGENGDPEFIFSLQYRIGKTMFQSWCRYEGVVERNAKLYSSYVAGGILGCFTENIKQGLGFDSSELGYFAGETTEWMDEKFVRGMHG